MITVDDEARAAWIASRSRRENLSSDLSLVLSMTLHWRRLTPQAIKTRRTGLTRLPKARRGQRVSNFFRRLRLRAAIASPLPSKRRVAGSGTALTLMLSIAVTR